MGYSDQRYGNIGGRRLGKSTYSAPLPALMVQRGMAFAVPKNEGQAAVQQRARLERLIADLSLSFVDLPASCIEAAIEDGLRHTVEVLGVELGALYGSMSNGLAVPVRVMRGGSLSEALRLGSSQKEISLNDGMAQQPEIPGADLAGALAHKQVEEPLIESDRLSRAMLGSVESHIVILDKGGKVIAVSGGKRFDSESDAPLLTSISAGVNYFDVCRLALGRGWVAAKALLAGIEAVGNGSQELFEMEYEWLLPSGRKFFQVSVARLGDGAVISHIETTDYRMAQTSLRELNGKVIKAMEEERARIARDLHDDLSQRLALMGLETDQLIQRLPAEQDDLRRRLRDLWKRNQEISSEVRRLSHQLHPSKLEYLGLVAAVKGICNELSQRQGVRIMFRHFSVPSSLPKDEAICIYRIIQEALWNVVKHSGAQEAQVVLSGDSAGINLCISDDGVGFDPSGEKAKAGIGLIGMRERLLLIGGEISIDSKPMRGTKIVARIPLKAPACNTVVSSDQKLSELTRERRKQ